MVFPQVVCVGVVTLDALALVDRYPGQDERVVAQEMRFAGGGPAATAAVVLARQGIPVGFVGRVGADAAGEQAVAELAAEGVDVSGVSRDPSVPTQTSCIVISRDTQTRAISTQRVPALGELAHAAVDMIATSEWVLADHLGFGPLAAQLSRMANRPLVAVDAGNPIPHLQFDLIDLFIPTVSSMCAVAGSPTQSPDVAAATLLAAGMGSVVATDGAEGSYAWWGHSSPLREPSGPGRAFAPAVSDVDITSTLGAGDVFHGGLLAALCRGENWEQALRSANATAALSCRALDGRTAIPGTHELNDALQAS